MKPSVSIVILLLLVLGCFHGGTVEKQPDANAPDAKKSFSQSVVERLNEEATGDGYVGALNFELLKVVKEEKSELSIEVKYVFEADIRSDGNGGFIFGDSESVHFVNGSGSTASDINPKSFSNIYVREIFVEREMENGTTNSGSISLAEYIGLPFETKVIAAKIDHGKLLVESEHYIVSVKRQNGVITPLGEPVPTSEYN